MSKRSFSRSRWVTAGVAVAVLLGAGGVLTSSAAGPPAPSTFVPITPCRLTDTRAAAPVGPRSTPIGAETYVAAVWGTNGQCTIPSTATAVTLNVTFVNPTAGGFLAVFPSDAAWPGTSNLNFSAGQAPAPNSVTSALSADGKLAFRNEAGTVNLLVDIVGYYVPASVGTPGPKGDPGTAPVDPCAAFVGTFLAGDGPAAEGLVIQLLAGGAMSAQPEPDLDVTVDQTTAQEGRWSCTGAAFKARTLDMYRSTDPGNEMLIVGRWDWAGSLTGSTLTFTRSLCDFELPLVEDVQTTNCGGAAVGYPTATAQRITIPEISAGSIPSDTEATRPARP